MDHNVILSIRDLNIAFHLEGRTLHALRGVSLDVHQGECLVIVGESGCGKSVLCRSCMGLLEHNGRILSGQILYGGRDLAALSGTREWQSIRGSEISMIFQNPKTSLNPLHTIGSQIVEAFLLNTSLTRKQAAEHTMAMLRDAGFEDAHRIFRCYPHQLSGGMCQRVCIAMAIACHGKLVLLDEPTSSLDVTTQAQILQYIERLRKKYGLTMVFVTHDLGIAARMADRIAVMYAGEIVECGTAEELFFHPAHPYTWSLLSSLPQLSSPDGTRSRDAGVPDLTRPVTGDAFAPRNPFALNIDYQLPPPMHAVTPTHWARTWLLDSRAPAVPLPPSVERIRILCAEAGGDMQESACPPDGETILQVHDLSVTFGRGKKATRAVRNVTFDIKKGEIFGLVGESGSGKTTIGNAIMRLCQPSGGEIRFNGTLITGKIPRRVSRAMTPKLQMIFQDPLQSLNDRAKINDIVREGLQNIHPELSRREQNARVGEILQDVGLLPEHAERFPYSFSGGQLQRVGIARALIMEPSLIVADEPVSALDVSVRSQILDLLLELREKRGLSFLFISHDLSVMQSLCDRIAVIKAGVLVELGSTRQIFSHPLHPYTRSLLSAIPVPNPEVEKQRLFHPYDGSPDPAAPMEEPEPGHFVRME